MQKASAARIGIIMRELCHVSGDADVTGRALAGQGTGALPSSAMLPSAATPPLLPTAQDVDAAAQLLRGVALRTPLIASPVLDALTGARVFLKAETLKRTGSAKVSRGDTKPGPP